jgi:hypothetical protein
MTTLTKTQYLLTWSGEFPKWGYSSTSNHLGGLFASEKEAYDYLDEKVSHGWVVLEATLTEVK